MSQLLLDFHTEHCDSMSSELSRQFANLMLKVKEEEEKDKIISMSCMLYWAPQDTDDIPQVEHIRITLPLLSSEVNRYKELSSDVFKWVLLWDILKGKDRHDREKRARFLKEHCLTPAIEYNIGLDDIYIKTMIDLNDLPAV